MTQPLLAVVSDPPGSDTTTLAHMLAREIPCPGVCRDEIKEGLVHSRDEYTPALGDEMARRTLDVFFGVIRFLVEAGVSLVAESAFQHRLWEPGLRPLLDSASLRIVHCRVDFAVAWERIGKRVEETPARLAVHGDYSLTRPFESSRRASRASTRSPCPFRPSRSTRPIARSPPSRRSSRF